MTTLSLPTTADSDAYPPLSALNDLLFCPRRCALHRLEGLWQENVHTTAGVLDHRRVHAPGDTGESTLRVVRGPRLVSHQLRLVGVADLVEFRPGGAGNPPVPFPVEYKRSRRCWWDNDEVQLCAQALCLEEMLGVAVPDGAIFHVRSRRRRDVALTDDLRLQTRTAARQLHELLASSSVPLPVPRPQCSQCSLKDICLPDLIGRPGRYRRLADALFDVPCS